MATTATASSDAGEGPVMALINKRLRALRKKLNRIAQMEESISQGKTLNKEQQEVLRSKPSVLVLIDELDKLRSPLSSAVSEEISLATQNHHQQAPSDQTTTAAATATAPPEEKEVEEKLEDLVNLLYFGSLFDVRSASELASVMMTRRHERGCCLVYDTVTDESTEDLLCDKDLDLISKLWGMMVSRPADSGLSHEKALERCVEHAKLWLASSDQAIASNCDVSYAVLREKVKKIMGSNYFTITPEMVVAPVEAAAEAGHFGGSFQVAGDSEQKEGDASNFKEQESVGNDQYEQPKDESVVTEGEVVQGQQEQGYTQVEGGRSKRDYQQQQQYVPRGTHQNQRGHRGARRGHSNAPRGGRGGGGGYSNGRFESYDNAGGNGYQRSYYNNRGRGRGGGGGGGNGHSYNNNNHQDSNVSVAS